MLSFYMNELGDKLNFNGDLYGGGFDDTLKLIMRSHKVFILRKSEIHESPYANISINHNLCMERNVFKTFRSKAFL